MKITALVVTYNRVEWLKKNVRALLNQSRLPDEILIVDNASTDSTKDFLSELQKKEKRIFVKRLNENLGGSGGFSRGLKEAIARGAEWVWMMDDDALPYENSLEELEKYIQKFESDESVGALLSKLVKVSNALPKSKISLSRTGTFVGFAVSAKTVEKVGLPDEGFFIYADDYEYSLRIRHHGLKLIKVHSSLIEHKDWIRQKRIFRFPFSKPSIPPWKVYYIFRNALNATKDSKFINTVLKGYFFIDRYIWAYVSPETKPYAFHGFEDGIKGVKGKIVDPRNPKWK
jgi:rhamnopyranosyl-N-acetylglucosaminyl-diphospho-decaprenol beta-1,3/1,4-galactofuranosyltransferase